MQTDTRKHSPAGKPWFFVRSQLLVVLGVLLTMLATILARPEYIDGVLGQLFEGRSLF